MTDEQLAEIEARYAAATAGPWVREAGIVLTTIPSFNVPAERVFYHDNGDIAGQYMGICRGAYSPSPFWRQELADLDFIAHARADVLVLLAEIARLKAATP